MRNTSRIKEDERNRILKNETKYTRKILNDGERINIIRKIQSHLRVKVIVKNKEREVVILPWSFIL